MKHSLVKPIGSLILMKRYVGEKLSANGLIVSTGERGVEDFITWGEVIAVAEHVPYAKGDKLIFHELSVEGCFRDDEDSTKEWNYLLVPSEKILGVYGE